MSISPTSFVQMRLILTIQSRVWNPESRTFMDSLTWGDFVIYRKDRYLGAGGVLIAVRNDLIASQENRYPMGTCVYCY